MVVNPFGCQSILPKHNKDYAYKVWSGIVHYFTSYAQSYQMMEAKMPVLPLRACLTGTFWEANLVVAGALNPAVNSSTCVLNICSELMF